MPKTLCIEEPKSDQADENLAIPLVQFGAARNVFQEQFGIDGIIQHHQVTPLRGQEDVLHIVQMR